MRIEQRPDGGRARSRVPYDADHPVWWGNRLRRRPDEAKLDAIVEAATEFAQPEQMARP